MKKAKIIVLSGQSNAVGVGHTKCLKRSFTDEKIEEYFNGYNNIKINYYSHDKKSDGFTVTAKGCTEIHKDAIGPELGIAEYLNNKFPDEEFYIAKFAIGGASLKRDFLSPSSGGYSEVGNFKKDFENFVKAYLSGESLKAGWCYNGLVSVVGDSIKYLKEKGMEPEIIGFCWMQGEADATAEKNAAAYIDRYDALLRDIRSTFAPYFEDCKFIDGGISKQYPFYERINREKANYDAAHGYQYLDTIGEGLTTHKEPEEAPDLPHYDCGSVVRLGEMFARKINL